MSVNPRLPENARDRLRRLVETSTPSGLGTREDLVAQLCELAATELSLMGAAVTLMPSTGRHLVLGASSQSARRCEQAQFDVGQGPTADAAATRLPVLVHDLYGYESGRWVGFESQVRGEGVAAVFALPLLLGATTFGTVTLYRGHPARLRADELRTAYVFRDLLVEVMLDTALPSDENGSSQVALALERELEDQAVVYQAQGMVMVQLGGTLVDALARMRARAYAQGLTLAELSQDIINGTSTFMKGDQR